MIISSKIVNIDYIKFNRRRISHLKKKCLMTLAIATVAAITAQLTQIQATTVTESVATPVPTISCTSTHFDEYLFIPSYCVHDVDANRDSEFTIFDLIRVKESIVNNPENVYNAQDLLHLQYVLLNVQKPCLGGAPLPAITPTAEPEED